MKKRLSPINQQTWMAQLKAERQEIAIIEIAANLIAPSPVELQHKGFEIAEVLLSLGLDNESLAAAILYPTYVTHTLTDESILENMGETCHKLLNDISQMRMLHRVQTEKNEQQRETLRKMLLAMVSDVRSILIALAEKLWELREARLQSAETKIVLAKNTLHLYAPLANRLGVWQFKWEMEDLALKYLEPDVYSQIAKSLSAKREQRESYNLNIQQSLKIILREGGLRDFEITGRVKHIYSIFQKMKKKKSDFNQIYDVFALRVLVNSIDDCYNVLSIIQNQWQQLPEEFDDYIHKPKLNGYQSIHTVVQDAEKNFVEIQIRTFQMHHNSEMGVAAHWRYKEGILQTATYEAKISLLRQIMAWQKDALPSTSTTDIFADRVYVFTPMGEVIDLPKGATALDFAYHIHSEVGNRCRGAKINGNIVSLKTILVTGARIEILTGKHANPSRDWINQKLGYLFTARARAKVQHWFRMQASKENAVLGKESLDKELKKNGISLKINWHELAGKYNYKHEEDLYAAIGIGDVKVPTIINQLTNILSKPITELVKPLSHSTNTSIQIEGINNLLTYVAKCCKPSKQDSILGYVTLARGITIHKDTCRNIYRKKESHSSRIIAVNWQKC